MDAAGTGSSQTAPDIASELDLIHVSSNLKNAWCTTSLIMTWTPRRGMVVPFPRVISQHNAKRKHRRILRLPLSRWRGAETTMVLP
jgi:hypothetical protein